MATTITGLDVEDGGAAGDDGPTSPEEELCRLVLSRIQQRCYRAALGAAVDLTNLIAQDHGLNGGAWL